MCRVNPTLENILREKAANSPCTYKISAIAFDKKGDVLGHATNSHSKNWNVLDKDSAGRPGTGIHAERKLLERYRGLVKTILICRIGRGGDLRPIEPCETCSKVARKYGVKIMTISP